MTILKKEIQSYDRQANTGPERTVGPAKKLFAVTLDQEYESVGRGLLIGVAGNVNLEFTDGTSITVPLQAGFNPIEHVKVNTSGTTATGLFWFN